MMEGQERKFFGTWSTLAAAGASHDTKKQDQPTKNSTTTCPSPLLAQTCPKMWHCVKFCWRKIWHSVMMEGQERKFFGTWSTLAAVGSSHDTKKQDQPTKNSTTTCPSCCFSTDLSQDVTLCQILLEKNLTFSHDGGSREEVLWYLKYSSSCWGFPWHQEIASANQKHYYYMPITSFSTDLSKDVTLCQILLEKNMTFSHDGGSIEEVLWYLKYSSSCWIFPWHQKTGSANQKQYYYMPIMLF